MTSLFLKPVNPHAFFEKQASIAKMPDDDIKWPAHVLSNLHLQLPFLSQYEVDLDMQRIEPEAGFAFGHALVMAKNDPAAATASKNPQNIVRIPIIVADRQLQPFHTFELGGNVYPLTAERVQASLLNPAMFQGPADQPQRQKSLIDQMYPPYQQRQGFGRVVGDGASSMGINKLSSARAVLRDFRDKIAAATDAPNYRPTAGDDRCETCSYFRPLNDGAGYCERFSFQAEPQSICDDFVIAGNVKQAMNPYLGFGSLGGALGAGKAIYQKKDEILADRAARDAGEITPEEYSARVRRHALSVGTDAALGTAAGVGGTAAVKKVLLPAAKRAVESGASFAEKTLSQSAKNVVDNTVDAVQQGAERAAENVPLLRAAGVGKPKPTRSIWERLRSPFQGREQTWQDIADGKTAAAPGIQKLLRDMYNNPIAQSAAIPGAAGAVVGAGTGAYGSGEDKYREGLKGGAVGAATGTLLGLVGPGVRHSKASREFSDETAKLLAEAKDSKKGLLSRMSEGKKALKDELPALRQSAQKLRSLETQIDKLKRRIASLPSTPQGDALQQLIDHLVSRMDARKEKLNEALNSAMAALPDAQSDLADRQQRVDQIQRDLAQIEQEINRVAQVFEDVEKRKYTPDMRGLATSGMAERLGVPAGAAALGGVLGFGLSQDSKEHERFRKSTAK